MTEWGWLGEAVSRHGLGLGLLAAFVGGLALNLTPCVYPMVPVTLAFFSSQAAGSPGRVARLAACYVGGISLSYAALGFIAAKTGALLGSWLQHPLVLLAVAAAITALALSMFGLYDLRPPQVLVRRLNQAAAGMWGAFLMGLVVGLVASPCIGPFVLGLMLLVSQLANPAAGFLLFFALGLGMGLPYLLLALLAHRLGTLPKAGRWVVWVKRALGVALLGVALYVAKPILPAFSWPAPPQGPSVTWVPYSESALAEARDASRPAMVDVYADWCLPCVEMERVTFRHPAVVTALADVATFRLDVTRDVSPDGQRLLERYDVFGVPTMLFFDRTGREHPDLRLSGFLEPENFLQRLKQIRP